MTPGGTDGFFQRRLEWSKYKHDILNKYLKVWVSKLGSFPPHQLAFVDACAGEGSYGEGENREDGSPLLAVRCNDEHILQSRGGRLMVYACEADPQAAAKLELALRPWLIRNPPQARVFNSAFEDVLPEILELTRRVPTLFFIDPYGLDSLTGEKLKPLLSAKNRVSTEVLVRVDPVLLARFAGWVKSEEKSGQSDKRRRTAASFRRRLEMYNIDVDAIAKDPRKSGQTMELFAEYLKLFTARFKYVQIIPIRPTYTAAPKYYLIHGSDSPHGAAKINDAVSTTEDSLFRDSDSSILTGQVSMFEPVVELRATRQDAKDYVLELLAAQGEQEFVELQAQLVMRFGPDLREKHHRAAVRQLIEEGRVVRVGEGTEISENTRIRLR